MWLILLVSLVFLHYLYVRRKFDKFAYMGIPHQPGTYPFGSWVAWEMIMGKVSFIQMHEKVAQMFPGAKVVGYYGFGGSLKFIINDMELFKKIMVKDFDHFPDRTHANLNPKANRYLYQSISIAKYDQWKATRTLLSPVFSSSKLKGILPALHEVTDEWLKLLEKMGKDDIDAKAASNLALAEYLSRIGCGVKPGILLDEKPEENPFYKKIMTLLGKEGQGKMLMKYMFSQMFPKIAYAMNLAMFDVEASEFLANTIKNSIKLRQASGQKMNDFVEFLKDALENLDIQDADKAEIESTDFGAYAKSKNYQIAQKLSPEQVEDLIITQGFETFISGIDTSGGAIAITTYFLACHPELQEQVYQEIEDAIAGNNDDYRLSYAQIQELKFLDAFIKESQRSHGVSFLERICVKDYPIPELNITIPKDALVQTAGATLMHREEFYPNPTSFDPAGHFLNDSFSPGTFLTFGAGPHNCIGMRFGLMIVKTMLTALISKYKILPGPGFQTDFELDPMDMNALPKGGVHVRLEPRN